MIRQFLNLIIIYCLALASPLLTANEQIRIVSTDASATELLVALGFDQYLVGVDITSQPITQNLTSKQLKGKKLIANIGYHRNLSAEGLLSLFPNLVVGSEHIGPRNVVDALNLAKIELIQLSSPQSIPELQKNISQLSSSLGIPDLGITLNNHLDQKNTTLSNSVFKHDRVAFLLTIDSNKLRLAGTESSGHAFIQLLGAQNIATFKNYQNVSAESLLALNPSAIIVAGKHPEKAVSTLLHSHAILAMSDAGQAKRIISINSASLIAGLSVSAIDEAIRVSKVLSNKILDDQALLEQSLPEKTQHISSRER